MDAALSIHNRGEQVPYWISQCLVNWLIHISIQRAPLDKCSFKITPLEKSWQAHCAFCHKALKISQKNM